MKMDADAANTGRDPDADLDPQETREWKEALTEVIERDGPERAHFLISALVDKARGLDMEIGTVVAPVWPPTGGGSAMGSPEDRRRFLEQVSKACGIAQKIRAHGVRPNGGVRIDSSGGVDQWAEDPAGMTK